MIFFKKLLNEIAYYVVYKLEFNYKGKKSNLLKYGVFFGNFFQQISKHDKYDENNVCRSIILWYKKLNRKELKMYQNRGKILNKE